MDELPELPETPTPARVSLSVSIHGPNFQCDACKEMVSVVRTGPQIEGQICDDCAAVK